MTKTCKEDSNLAIKKHKKPQMAQIHGTKLLSRCLGVSGDGQGGAVDFERLWLMAYYQSMITAVKVTAVTLPSLLFQKSNGNGGKIRKK